MKEYRHNTFRHTDAYEYVHAYLRSVKIIARHSPAIAGEKLRHRMRNLSSRMGDNPRSSLLAAYRGYEAAYSVLTTQTLPGVVKLDDTDPSPCERLTPMGYVFP